MRPTDLLHLEPANWIWLRSIVDRLVPIFRAALVPCVAAIMLANLADDRGERAGTFPLTDVADHLVPYQKPGLRSMLRESRMIGFKFFRDAEPAEGADGLSGRLDLDAARVILAPIIVERREDLDVMIGVVQSEAGAERLRRDPVWRVVEQLDDRRFLLVRRSHTPRGME